MNMSVKLIFQDIVRRAWLIVLCAIIGLGAAFSYTKLFVAPVYTVSMKVSALTNIQDDESVSSVGTYINMMTLAERRVQTYLELMDTTSFYQQIAVVSGTKYSASTVRSMLNFTQVEDMGLFYVTITGTDADAVYLICQALAQEMPIYVEKFQSRATLEVVDMPSAPPTTPINQTMKTNCVVGMLAGAFLAVAGIAVIAYFDTHIKDEESLSRRYNMPVLGSVPNFSAITSKKNKNTASTEEGAVQSATELNEADGSLKFKVVESYKVLRANIMFSIIKSGCKSFVVSSSLPSEGKSTIAVNTAIALSQTDARVLLVDTDLRRPKINRFLNLPNTPGLSNYLIGMNGIDEVLHKTQYPNLTVFCAGSRVPNPSELLASSQMEALLELLKQKFDYIVIDSAPLNVVSDTYPIVKNTDGLLLVTYQNKSDYKELDKTLKNLEMMDCKTIGFVFNGVENKSTKNKKHGYGYGYSYGYGYGYGAKSSKKSK